MKMLPATNNETNPDKKSFHALGSSLCWQRTFCLSDGR